jgi:hypothetical protein
LESDQLITISVFMLFYPKKSQPNKRAESFK